MQGNATVVRLRGVSKDKYGDPTGADDRLTLDGCAFAPASSTDIVDRGRDGATTTGTLYGPPGTDLLHTDRVEIDGVVYEIDGDLAAWSSAFTSWAAGFEVGVRRAVG